MHLYQLLYSSVRNSSCTDAEIAKILAACKKNNPGLNITGVLIHTQNNFIQYLEGGKDIIRLYDRIKTDTRHSRVVMLNYAPLQERIFPSWHMGYKDLSKQELAFHTEISSDDQKLFNNLVKGREVTDSNAVKLLTKFFVKD